MCPYAEKLVAALPIVIFNSVSQRTSCTWTNSAFTTKMPLRTARDKNCRVAIAPVHPELKSSNRKRVRVDAVPCEQELLDEDELELECLLWEQEEQEPVPVRLVQPTKDRRKRRRFMSEPTDKELSREVENLRASVVSMEKQVSTAACKIQELRKAIEMLLHQRQQL